MDLNRQNMTDLFSTFNTSFREGMERGLRGALPSELVNELVMLKDIAMVTPSTGAQSVYGYLNQLPGFRRWLGDRQKKNIASGKLTVVNADWEDTITVKRNDIEDDQYGLYTPLFANMGAEAAEDALWLDMVIDALLANGKWADDKAFFVTNRSYGNNAILNKVTDALSQTSLDAAVATMCSYKGPENNPLAVVPAILLVGPTLRGTAWDLVKNQFVSSGTGKGGAVENRSRGIAALRTHPKLTGAYANNWYLLGMKGAMKPCGVQQRRLPKLVAKDSLTDDNVFEKGEFIYGADARGEAFLTMPHLAYAGIVAP